MDAVLAVMNKQREEEWEAYLKGMAYNPHLPQLREKEQLLHDLYVTGEITMEDALLIVAGHFTVEDLVGNTSILAYACVLCRDTGCEFCGKVENS